MKTSVKTFLSALDSSAIARVQLKQYAGGEKSLPAPLESRTCRVPNQNAPAHLDVAEYRFAIAEIIPIQLEKSPPSRLDRKFLLISGNAHVFLD
jgi:hypothetical protein